MLGNLVKRSDKVFYLGVKGEGSTEKFYRMQGFTENSASKNPKEYNRQYTDEDFERTDVTGYSPSMSYEFDQYQENKVHEDLVKISDDEIIGTSAIRSIVQVDLTKKVTASGVSGDCYAAIKRDFSVIPDGEGGSMDAYTYSGTFKSNGEKISGYAKFDGGDFETITFSLIEESGI